jgi:hypothetical protein
MRRNSSIVREIKAWSVSFHTSTFAHGGRASNFEAHNLAKHYVYLDHGRHMWLGVPNCVTIHVNILSYQ